MELKAEFIDAVKARKIEGLSSHLEGVWQNTYLHGKRIHTQSSEWASFECFGDAALSAHLRVWIWKGGYEYRLMPDYMEVWYQDGVHASEGVRANEGNEIDWHIAAVLWVLEQESKGL